MFYARWAALLILPLLLVAAEIPGQDRRNTEIRHLDLHYTMPQYATLQNWEQRAAFLRKQILFSAGLWPLPKKTPLHPQVFDKVSREGYSVEKVLIETYPGFFLGGNLYRPAGKSGPFPGIVSPHGHWNYGRLENTELGSVPARCINLARQGFVVFSYDMVGYDDTNRLPHELETKHEQLWSIGLLGLQLWNSVRAVDFLSSLSDVDPSRIGATGASGGATQTFLLSAVDDRIKFSSPVNMISSIMQGGSLCENAANLRIDTNNMEIGALMAPRPMLMVAATGDWTRNTPSEEFPAVQSIYRLYGKDSDLEMVQIDAPHNYNRQSREAVYSFFNRKILNNADPTASLEKPYRPEQPNRLLVFWGKERPRDEVGRQGLIDYLRGQAEQQIRERQPRDAEALGRAVEFFREGLSFSILASLPAPGELLSESLDKLPNGEVLVVGRRDKGDRIPTVVLEPRKATPGLTPVLLVHPEGTSWVLSASESPGSAVHELLARGVPVIGIDVFQTGRAKASREIVAAGPSSEKFFTTYNRTDDANRIQDILTATAYARARLNATDINLVGFGMAGVWSLFARSLAGDHLNLIADMAQFDAGSDDEYITKLFIPGLRRSGDFRAAVSVLPPGAALLHNTGVSFPADWAEQAYAAAGVPERLEIRPAALPDAELVERLAPKPTRPRRR
jgi:dienelactone hydrolase